MDNNKDENLTTNNNIELPDMPQWVSKDWREANEQAASGGTPPPKRRRSKPRFQYKRLAVIIVILLLGILGAIWFLHSNKHASRPEFAHTANSSAINILVLGVDKRQDDGGRSDTIFLLTFNPQDKSTHLLSLPRDTRIPIKDNDFEKLNHAYAYGGYKLSTRVVENLLHVPVDYYLEIDLHAFEQFINAIGGIDINVPKRMYYVDPYDDNGGLTIDFYPGEQHMNGKQAMEYVRYRDGQGDIGRIRRQQQFMKAVLNKLISPAILPKLPDIITSMSKVIHTNMPTSELLNLVTDLPSIQKQGLHAEMIPGKPAYVNDISYWLPDIIKSREMVAANMGIKFDAANDPDTQTTIAHYQKYLPKDLHLGDDSDTPEQPATTTDEPASKTDEPKPEDTPAPTKEVTQDDISRQSQPEDITVLVINDSGINGAGARVADILKHKGFKISSVETGNTSSRERTIIMASPADLNNFYGMPFTCTIMDGGSRGQAVVHIGKDYEN